MRLRSGKVAEPPVTWESCCRHPRPQRHVWGGDIMPEDTLVRLRAGLGPQLPGGPVGSVQTGEVQGRLHPQPRVFRGVADVWERQCLIS